MWPDSRLCSALAASGQAKKLCNPPLAAQAEQKGAGLASAAASGKFVFKGASTASQECKLLMDRKFLEFMVLQCEEARAFKNSQCHFIFIAWQGVSYTNRKGKHSTPLNEYG